MKLLHSELRELIELDSFERAGMISNFELSFSSVHVIAEACDRNIR